MGMPGVNDFSVGIELVNLNDGSVFCDDQLKSCSILTSAICKDNSITSENVVGHADIAPGRKTDPFNFPWDKFRTYLIENGVK